MNYRMFYNFRRLILFETLQFSNSKDNNVFTVLSLRPFHKNLPQNSKEYTLVIACVCYAPSFNIAIKLFLFVTRQEEEVEESGRFLGPKGVRRSQRVCPECKDSLVLPGPRRKKFGLKFDGRTLSCMYVCKPNKVDLIDGR